MVHVEGLRKSFGDVEVLKGVNLDVQDGETVAIIGPSGSGKSTFLRCLNLLEQPDAGTVEIGAHRYEGGKISKATYLEMRRATAMVFQGYHLFLNKTVIQNITMPLTVVKKADKAQAEDEARSLLERVGLADKANAMPDELSGGQQQRVAIARALALKPEVMLYDEPTSALDPELVQGVLDVIKSVVEEENVTQIIVTHEMRFARDVADRVAFIDEGVVAECGPAREVIDHPQHERLQKFLQRYLEV
jgi:ABC-type polar amino acid transport system ATPase subunit